MKIVCKTHVSSSLYLTMLYEMLYSILFSTYRSLSISAGACALFTYATYATLPVRLHEATVGGVALGAVNIGAHLVLDKTTDVVVSI